MTLRTCLLSVCMTTSFFRHLPVVGVMLLYTASASADAIVRSEAMFADTIAEYFVEDDHVRLELEIGPNDLGSFRNLLPDALYQRLGYGDTPITERLSEFTTRDMPVLVGGDQLIGRITNIGPATRPLRDEITGEALPTPEAFLASLKKKAAK